MIADEVLMSGMVCKLSGETTTVIPENCRDCGWGKLCSAGHYGAYGCRYADEIVAMRNRRKKGADI